MKRILPFVLLVIVACWTMNSFAQTDPRIWNTRVVTTGEHYVIPEGSINYRNPNHTPMVYRLGSEMVVVEPNFRVYPSTTTQSEVPIIASKVNPDWIFASSNTWNGSVISEGDYRSADGGNTWTGTDILNSAPTNAHWGDPGPAIGPDGRFYHSHLFDLNGWDAGMRVTYSTDFGTTWANDITIGNFASDKNHTVVNEISGSPYYGRALVSWSDFSAGNPPITVSWSSNGGLNWSAALDVNTPASGHYCQGVNGQVAPNGDFYLVWANPVTGYPYTEDNIGFAKSTDGGVTWTYNNNVYDCNGIRGYLSFYGASDIRVNGFPWMAVDISGGARNGWIYVVTGEKGLAPAGNDPDVVMHVSTDGGATWSSGIRVNQDPSNNGKYQYMPAVCVGADGGVNVIYYDTRNAAISGGLPDSAEVFVSRSIDGGATFEDFLVSDHAFKPKPISGLADGYQGDYIGIAESNGSVYPFWCDDKSGIYQAWTTRITFGPPCPVEAALNPNPPAGAQNISINLSELTWENGAGSVTNELYFGTSPGSMTLVQSGNLATSWTIDPGYLPLNYFTNYYWQVVEIGDTCNKTGPLWSFKTIQDPNYVVVTDSLYPMSAQFWTGSTNGTTKTDGEINTVDPNLGWAVFDISSIPNISTIESINFYGYVNDTYYPYWSATPMPDNPVTATGSTIYNDAVAGQEQGIAYIYSNESSSFTTGWHTYPMESGAVPDLQAAVTSSQSWFATGIVDRDFSTTYYINFDGWSQSNPPFLQVTYHYIIPVELTSFTANTNKTGVTLNWQTATEVNNKGFEIQRSEVRGQNSEWTKIGYVAGYGTTTEPKSYSFNDNNVKSGSCSYRLKQIDLNGSASYSKEVEVNVALPAEFSLQQNYPNPFNPSTMIKYSIPEDQHIKLSVYNLLGQKVAILVDGKQKAGEYEISFDGSRLSSGVYFYKLEAGQQSSIKKMILMK